MVRKTTKLLCTIATGLAIPTVAMAQSCSWSVSGISFGVVDTLSGSNSDTTGTATINCTGTAGRTIRLCPNIGPGAGGLTESDRRLLSGGNALSYQLYQDSARTTVWGSDLVTPNPPTPPTLAMTLNASGSGSLAAAIYGRVIGGQVTAPSGSYSSAFSTANHRQMRYVYCSGGPATCPVCSSSISTSANAPNFTVSATVASNCMVSATTLDFGSKGALNANTDATNTITVRCTPSTAWRVGLNAGSGAGGTLNLRRMTGPVGATVAYTIHRNAGRTEVWGDGTSGSFTVAGTGNGNAQVQTGYGRVPSQTTPRPATYTDTIVVTVTY